jgi:hypothetical protein
MMVTGTEIYGPYNGVSCSFPVPAAVGNGKTVARKILHGSKARTSSGYWDAILAADDAECQYDGGVPFGHRFIIVCEA